MEFYNVNRLDDVVLTFFMLFHKPGAISAASPNVLMYEDTAKDPREVHWLDCSSSPPKPMAGTIMTSTQQSHVKDMCRVNDRNKWLLVTIQYSTGIFAYDAETSKLEWSIAEALPGNQNKVHPQAITAGRRGHLFVSDSNNACIQMFGANGTYFGAALQSKFAKLRSICWNGCTSSLIVVHAINSYCNFSVAYVTTYEMSIHSKLSIHQKTPVKASIASAKVRLHLYFICLNYDIIYSLRYRYIRYMKKINYTESVRFGSSDYVSLIAKEQFNF